MAPLAPYLLAALLLALGFTARGSVDRLRCRIAHRPPRHEALNVGGIEIDRELAPVLAWAQIHGLVTTCSCQDEHGTAYLKFLDPLEAGRLLEIIRSLPGIGHFGMYSEEPCAHPGSAAPDHELEYVVMWDREYTLALAASLRGS